MPDQTAPETAGPELASAEPTSQAISAGLSHLFGDQAQDGHWSYELEADATIPAEYIILNHFLGEPNPDRETKLARYLRRTQNDEGGWPLFPGGEANVSASVKAYFALKLAGDDPEAEHMRRARERILAQGGLPACNVFTKITLAIFGFIPWSALPVMRVEIVVAPDWFPIHLEKVSYWSRTVMVPLLILVAKRARARNPKGVGLDELMPAGRGTARFRLVNPTGHWLGSLVIAMDRLIQPFEPLIPPALTERAIEKAMKFVTDRLNGQDGLGGIFPAMANALMALRVLGVPDDDLRVTTARRAIDKLLIERDGEIYCQPCLSPVWDTGLALLAALEAGEPGSSTHIRRACDWLADRQISSVNGDWRARRPDLAPGGWAFQYRNDYYPDVDDTAVVVMALHRADPARYRNAIAVATDWILGMQSANGGWGAFDAENEHYTLNHIPFADHGALLDPPTADVTARCLGMLVQLGYDRSHPAIQRAVAFLRRSQEPDGSWFGRWGTNYVYGTWSVLSALNAVGEDSTQDCIQRAADWLEACQQADGGWGESCDTYWDEKRDARCTPLASQTGWALLGLMAAGRTDTSAVKRGIDFLVQKRRDDGTWHDPFYNAVGFARVFYLKYHGYAKYFPLMAIARYRNLTRSNFKRPVYGL